MVMRHGSKLKDTMCKKNSTGASIGREQYWVSISLNIEYHTVSDPKTYTICPIHSEFVDNTQSELSCNIEKDGQTLRTAGIDFLTNVRLIINKMFFYD